MFLENFTKNWKWHALSGALHRATRDALPLQSQEMAGRAGVRSTCGLVFS
jgi:hypothetical protein